MKIFERIKNTFSDQQTVVIEGKDEQAVKTWLLDRLAKQLKTDVSKLDPSMPFDEYGLDSIFAIRVTGELEKVVEMRLSPALLFENTCIDDVAHFIASAAANK